MHPFPFRALRVAGVVAAILAFSALATLPTDAAEQGFLGRETAAEVATLYISPGCPYCRQTLEELQRPEHAAALATGDWAIRVVPAYFDTSELRVDMLARCTGGGYLATMMLFMEQQPAWSMTYHRERKTGVTIDDTQQTLALHGIVVDRGIMTKDVFVQCLSNKEGAKRLIADYQARSKADNLRAVPMLIAGEERLTGTRVLDWIKQNLR